jgi:hypothetical protein
MRIVSAGVCSKESGIERRRTLMAVPAGQAYRLAVPIVSKEFSDGVVPDPDEPAGERLT